MKVTIKVQSLSRSTTERLKPFLVGDADLDSLSDYIHSLTNLDVIAIIGHDNPSSLDLVVVAYSEYFDRAVSICVGVSDVSIIDGSIAPSWEGFLLDEQRTSSPTMVLAHPYFQDPDVYYELRSDFWPPKNYKQYV